MNVYSNPALCLDVAEKVKISAGERQNVIEYGDVLFTGSSETVDECGMTSVVTQKPPELMYLNSFCFGFRLNESNMFVPDFLKHLFRGKAMRKQLIGTANGVTRFNVSKKLMADVSVPIPPIAVQREIVSVLDKFSALCSDLTSGLPAEISARRKQYEYYRDKLLSFKRKA